MGPFIKKILYKYLSLENYLSVLSKVYFLFFDLGILRSNPSYEYHYYIKQIVKPGDTVVDIGANLGYYSRNLSKWVGPKGKVIAYEPVLPIFNVLKKNLRHCKNVSIYPYALGEEDKDIEIGNITLSNQPYLASGSNFVISGNEKNSRLKKFKAEMKNAQLELKKFGRINFIKCDVEGYEFKIFTHIRQTLSDYHPTVLVESHGQNRNKTIDLFERLGYTSYLLIDGKLVLLSDVENSTKDILFMYK